MLRLLTLSILLAATTSFLQPTPRYFLIRSLSPPPNPSLLRSTQDETPKKNGLDPSTKLVAESIAPWRTLRLFFYFSLGSGAFIGGLISLSGTVAALNGLRGEGVDFNTEYVNLAIDFGAVALFAIAGKLDLDKGKELEEETGAKIEERKEKKKIVGKMKNREKQLSALQLSIQVSGDGARQEARVSAIQEGAKQDIIIIVGKRSVIKDALLGANLLKMEFSMRNILVVPYEIGANKKERPEGGFGDRPTWETQPYVASVAGEGWEEYINAEMEDAVLQGGEKIKEEGIAIVLANTGKVIQRGVGKVPWRQMVEKLSPEIVEADDY